MHPLQLYVPPTGGTGAAVRRGQGEGTSTRADGVARCSAKPSGVPSAPCSPGALHHAMPLHILADVPAGHGGCPRPEGLQLDDGELSATVRAALGTTEVGTGAFWGPAYESYRHDLDLAAQSLKSRQLFAEVATIQERQEEGQYQGAGGAGCSSAAEVSAAETTVYEDVPTVSGPIAEHLTASRFHAVAMLPRLPAQSTAGTIVWCNRNRVIADRLPSAWFPSDFRGEHWLTHKDLLARLIHLTAGRVPWYPQSFVICSLSAETGSLRSQHASFVGAYAREPAGAVWIVKPCRGRRSKGITISDDLAILLRACSFKRPELGGSLPEDSFVVSRYLLHPCLFDGRKFDLRFMVTLANLGRSGTYVLGVYENWIVRCADHPYTKDDFGNERKHLTVMQYMDERATSGELRGTREYITRQQLCEHLCAQYGVDLCSMSAITAVCCSVILECFTLAISGVMGEADEAVGIAPDQHGLQCGALYGLDLMLCPPLLSRSKSLQAFLLEVNPRPDARRALHENPRFYDEVFGTLFTTKGRSGLAPASGWRMFKASSRSDPSS